VAFTFLRPPKFMVFNVGHVYSDSKCKCTISQILKQGVSGHSNVTMITKLRTWLFQLFHQFNSVGNMISRHHSPRRRYARFGKKKGGLSLARRAFQLVTIDGLFRAYLQGPGFDADLRRSSCGGWAPATSVKIPGRTLGGSRSRSGCGTRAVDFY